MTLGEELPVPSELRRGVVRLAANYGRMVTNIVLGLWTMRLLLQGLHNEGFGLVGLLGATVGIMSLVQQTVNQSLIREVGVAYHDKDPRVFRNAYNSALLLVALAAAVVLIIYALVVWVVLPWLQMSDAMLPSARWFVIALSVQSLLGLVLAPVRNMYLIKEQMVAVNAWATLDTARRTAAAVVVAAADVEPVRGLILFGALSSGLSVLVQLAAAGWAIHLDRRLIPHFGSASRRGMRSIMSLGGWNAIMLVAMDVHLHAGTFIMNLAFGADFGSVIWHLGTRLTSYVRRVAMAAYQGIDAVTVRVEAEGGGDAVRRLLHDTTRFNGFAIVPCSVALFCLAEPCLYLLAADRLEDPQTTLPATVTLLRILTVAMACRGLSNGWFRVFYGAGHVRRYAPLVLVGAMANPLLACALLWLLPHDLRYTCAAWGYLAGFALFNAGVAARAGARAAGASFLELWQPLLRPALSALIGAPILVMPMLLLDEWHLWSLAAVGVAYFAAHVAVASRLVLNQPERQRFAQAIRRLLRGEGRGRRTRRAAEPVDGAD